MKIADYLRRFIDKKLWLILEGTNVSDSEKIAAEELLHEIVTALGEPNSQPSTRTSVLYKPSLTGIVSSHEQLLWIIARLLRKFKGSDHILLSKNARFESLLSCLNAPEHISRELRTLNEAVSNLISSDGTDGREVHLPLDVADFLHQSMVQGDIDAATGLVNCLLSPYLSHLSTLDANLLKVNQDAFQSALQTLESPDEFRSAVLLHLLAVTSDILTNLPQIHELAKNDIISKQEVFLALLARKETPPAYVLNYCNLDAPSENCLDNEGHLQVQNAFVFQNNRSSHWLLNYLNCLSQSNLERKTDVNHTADLKPLMMFHLWTEDCCNLSVINQYAEHSKNLPLLRLENLLRRRELVMSWIKKQEKLNAEVIQVAVLSLLSKYSPLKVLHQSGALLESNWDEIHKLLKSCKQDDTKSSSWESVTFQGYCIMIKAMNLFFSACKFNENHPKDFDQYQEKTVNVKEELNKLQSELKKLYPISFRLEILENIFSLLFLRYEHLKADEVASDSGGEDDDSLKSLATVAEGSLTPEIPTHSDQPDFAGCPSNVQPQPKKLPKSGFMCGPLIIRDTLAFMKECLVDCSSSLYKHKSDMEIEDTLDLQKKITIFSQSVTEAWWRLQLVTDLSDVVEYEKKSKNFIPQPQRGYLSSASSSDSDSELQVKPRARKSSFKSSRSENTDKSSGSGSNTTGGVSVSFGSRTKKNSRRKLRALNKLPIETDSIMNILLANPTSLAVLCLSRNDYKKAQQVVQTFHLENSDVANEANFLEMFFSLSSEVSKNQRSNPREFATELSPTNSKMIVSSSLELVRKAAMMGMSAVSVTSLVEKILAMAPVVHGMERLIFENHQAKMILSDITEKVMVSVDAALCLGNTSCASLSLMDVVSQYIKFSNTKSGVQGRGYAHFVTTIMELFRSLQSKERCGSAADTLGAWAIPLNVNSLNEYLSIILGFQTSLSDFFGTSSSARIKIASVRQLIKQLSDYKLKGVREAGKEELPYLQHLLWYLQTLSFVLTRCSSENMRGLTNPFDLLQDPWEEILSRLIFHFEAPLTRVERVANRLNLDLLQAIVGACCPSFQQSGKKHDPSVQIQPAAMAWAKISLNAATCQQEIKCGPDALAAQILTDLLSAIRQNDSILVTSSDLLNLSNNVEIVQILNETTKLSGVDLGSLEEDYQRTAFMCNICNLLMLHSLIALGPSSGLTSNSWTERRAAYNCIGYHIGQMGFVTLSGLLRQLVGTDYDDNLESKRHENFMWGVENKLALFAVSRGTIQSPFIKVYNSETIEIELESAAVDYIMHNIRVEGSRAEGCLSLILTPLVLQYLGLSSVSSLDPAVEAQDESQPSLPQQYFPVTSMARDCAAHIPSILGFLEKRVEGQLKLQLADWRDAWENSTDDTNDLVITVEDSSKKLGILLQSSMEVVVSDEGAHDQDHVTGRWESCSLSSRILQFLAKRCWIVALLGERLRRGVQEFQFYPHTESLDRYLGEKFALLSAFGDGNLILGALKPPWMILDEIWPILDRCVNDQNEEQCIQLICSLPEYMISENVRLQTFKDLLLFYAASQSRGHGIDMPHRLALSLGTAELRVQCILRSIQFWSGEDSIEALKTILGDPEISRETRSKALMALKKVSIYQQVHKILCYYQPNKTSLSDGWYQVLNLSDNDPGEVLRALIEAKQFQLCIQWADLHGVPNRANHLIDCNFVAPLLESSDSVNFAAAEKLLKSVSVDRAVSICRRLLGSLSSLASLQFVVNFALVSCKSWLEENTNVWANLQLWSVGLSIINLLPVNEQNKDRTLASKPHLLLEQFLMNTKLATLAEALDKLRNADLSAVSSDNPAQPNAIDSMLRMYADKALDFRVVQRVVPEVTTPEPEDLLQSLSTGSTGSGNAIFVMPPVPPSKSGWVPNDEVTECMCCRMVPFSMFNRRHHCRRCGRVVCGSCSNHRSKVDGYGELQVRICDDCFFAMKKDILPEVNKNAEPSLHSSQQTYIVEWTLTGEKSQDDTARDEFSFEHAPSVALCLSILGLHSEHAAAQPRFLLEASDTMLQMLVPPTPGFVNPELDYSLVIRMARSLVVAAKVRYAKAALNSGVAHCDRLLGQVDLLSLLVKSGCANLLPVEPLPLSGHALRHLRDRLLSAELWSLALEVSTKAGLDRTGVWAAWGKACLRAGKWQEAREHLVHCLQPPVSSQDSVPTPLLSEIIRILEEASYVQDEGVMKLSEHISSPALSVLHTLNSLSSISQGKFVIKDLSKQTACYTECQYYLRTYGTPGTTISFFLSHSDLLSALRFVKDRNVEPDVFAEALYKPCLVQGLVGQLYQEMRKMDPSLEMWKEIIMHVGRLLEQQGLWNSLYQLQLFAKDLVRAAMTCIRFYKAGARCYSDMSSEQLTKARGHIEDELAEHWASAGLKRRESSLSRSRSTESPDASESDFQIPLKLPARSLDHHINTISRQLEAAKFLQQCESEDRAAVVAISSAVGKLMAPTGQTILIPTLFGDQNERTLMATLILLCGKNIEEGFGITFRIIQYFRLKANRVYSLVATYLIDSGRSRHIPQLVNCIQSSGSADAISSSDELVNQCIKRLVEENADGINLSEPLLRLISETEAKIQAHLTCGYLKSAYLLAVKSGRVSDVKMILNEAERLNQPAMKRVCLQWLSQKERGPKM
ncbi:zinc finger FYVE domain-containing protein 26 isoform X2 [Neocloeon triangulifer]|uniref:zinc finger FYVE domain-containing protein 26 isoform X2 n=1 Tax=Neocloeon triangulifer TaxID=2078957 RepID=UPI00286EE36C|nr:zinc finger FYVE domain-containing protein 26 isoform X2 [Neocloeon triangulifer]